MEEQQQMNEWKNEWMDNDNNKTNIKTTKWKSHATHFIIITNLSINTFHFSKGMLCALIHIKIFS